MSTIVAVCGKGGVGKTTVSALLCRLLSVGHDLRILAVDADPAVGLGLALNLFPAHSVNDIRKEIIKGIRGHSTDNTDLAASIDYRIMEILIEAGKLAFLSIGRPEEEGCYCQLNTFLREAIETLSSQFDLILIDAEAGLEQVNRRIMRSVTHLLLVSDTTMKGIRVAESIRRVADEAMDNPKIGLLLNRARGQDDYSRVAGQTELPLIGWIPEDQMVGDFDSAGRSFLEMPACPALDSVMVSVMGNGFLPIH